jgi:transposase-like protein
MPQLHQPFTYVHVRSTRITPIACPHCGVNAHLMRRSPLGDGREIRTFECKDCRKQTEIIVRD